MDPRELFQSNLALIDRVIGRVCIKGRLFDADAEDFASDARLALLRVPRSESDGVGVEAFCSSSTYP